MVGATATGNAAAATGAAATGDAGGDLMTAADGGGNLYNTAARAVGILQVKMLGMMIPREWGGPFILAFFFSRESFFLFSSYILFLSHFLFFNRETFFLF